MPVHLRHRRTVRLPEPLNELEHQQLEAFAGRLVGMPSAPLALLGDRALQAWTLSDGHDAWLSGAEAVLFAPGTADVIDATIQSAFELESEVVNQRWTHTCIGEDCEACLFSQAV